MIPGVRSTLLSKEEISAMDVKPGLQVLWGKSLFLSVKRASRLVQIVVSYIKSFRKVSENVESKTLKWSHQLATEFKDFHRNNDSPELISWIFRA